jgi:hypothetical protein
MFFLLIAAIIGLSHVSRENPSRARHMPAVLKAQYEPVSDIDPVAVDSPESV